MIRSALPRVVFAASVDTEEDNWIASRQNITVANIAALPRMHERVAAMGLRLTYFSAYRVVIDPSAVGVLRDLQAAGAEIGAHLHPWNTPPLDEPDAPRNSNLKNLPADLQHRKITRLTDQIVEVFGASPKAFRAGRFAVGPETIEALIRCGYSVDSSVQPWVDWSGTDDGPNFVGAPQDVYRLLPGRPVTESHSDGPLVEVPITSGFNRSPFSMWERAYRLVSTQTGRRFRLRALVTQTGMLRQVMMSPEGSRSTDVIALARHLVANGTRHLQMIWHSPSLVPGLTPFARSKDDVDQLYRSIADVVDALPSFCSPIFATVSETASLLANGAD